MALEFGLARLAQHDGTHDLKDSMASFGVALGHTAMRGVEAVIVALPFAFVYEHRLFDFHQSTVLSVSSLFVGMEFLYYWHHRASHRIRFLWATHSVHHSATRMNLTAAIRLGWTGQITGNFLFYLPLAWIGFHPYAIVLALALNLFYQFFIHTEFAPRLGILEYVLNTPAHHRVHHASNEACLDKNFGGVLIVFDRLFGTFAKAPEDETLRYGLLGKSPSHNPLKIALGEWMAIANDLRFGRGPSDWRRILFSPPGAIYPKPPSPEPISTQSASLPLRE
jgi:sterol desaturase/sphingolipid hydroxylase (fatty acid hydroxylase superfamily)